MTFYRAICLALLALLLSCSSGNLRNGGAGQGIADGGSRVRILSADAQGIRIAARNPGPAGQYIELDPAGLPLENGIYSASTDNCLALAEVANGQLQLCLAPLSTTPQGELQLLLQGPGSADSRQTNMSQKDNQVRDLLVERTTDNAYRLSWTAILLGDYDHNGEVNVADLIPMAQYFGEHAPSSSAWSSQNPRFWVDGDGNNEINIADLTTIAQHLGTNIDHYQLLVRNSVVQSVPFSDGSFVQGSGLPRRFSVIIAAESAGYANEFSIIPYSSHQKSVGPASTEQIIADLSVRSTWYDMNLLTLCSDSRETAAAFQPTDQLQADCYSICRLIDPIDDFALHPPIEIELPFGEALFDNVDRENLCYLDMGFLPEYDLASGQPNTAGPDSPGIMHIDYPVHLPDDGRSYNTDIRFSLVDNSEGGDFLDIAAYGSHPGLFDDSPIRLNSEQSRLARDLDNDGDYSDESWLHDSDLNSLSDALEEKLRTDEKYFLQPGVQIVGTVEDLLPDKGLIMLSHAREYDDNGSESQFDELTLSFTELTQFVLANPLNQELEPTRIRANELEPGEQLTAKCSLQRLGPTGEALNFWASEVTQLEPLSEADSILAVPALTERRPGQIVNVTVYAGASSEAFNSLDRMTLHVLGGAEIIPGTVNAGGVGGVASDPDGIWETLGPQALQLAVNIYPMGFSGGKYYQNFDIAITPQSSLNLSEASGALFNFDLRVYEPAVVLAGYHHNLPVSRYRDAQGNLHDWVSQADEESIFVNLTAPQSQVLVPNGAESGDGSYWNPYVVIPGKGYPLQVIDELDGDITYNPNTWYVVSPSLAGYVDYSNPVLRVPDSYSGSFTVNAVYPGNLWIPQGFADRVYFRTP